MPQTYDVIFKGGTVVNQDGEIARDLGVTGGRIAAKYSPWPMLQ